MINQIFTSVIIALAVSLLYKINVFDRSTEEDDEQTIDSYERIKVFVFTFVICYAVLFFVYDPQTMSGGGEGVVGIEEALQNIITGDPSF